MFDAAYASLTGALSRVREGVEVSERRVVQEFALEAMRTINQVSSIGGELGRWRCSSG